MGILGRLFGRSEREPEAPLEPLFQRREIEVTAAYLKADRDNAALGIVGESHYQAALLAAAGYLTPQGPSNRDHVAALVLEPTNPYDRNAVAVYVGGRQVGHLSREDAVSYAPVMRWLAARGKSLAVDSYLTGGWDNGPNDRGSIGVVLHLGTPAETILDLACSDQPIRTDHPWPGAVVTVTGESSCRFEGVALDRRAVVWCAAKAGLIVSPRVTKKVQLVIDLDGDGITANVQKAREYGIPVIDETVFWRALGLSVIDGGEPIGTWKTRR